MNAADEQALAEQQRKERLAQQQADQDFCWLASTQQGRRILWSLMGRCHVFGAVFHPDPSQMSFNEGRRNTGLFLLGEINRLCPEQFAVMAAENAPKPEEEANQ